MTRKTFRHAYFLFFILVMLPTVYPVPVDAGWSDLGLYGGQVYTIAIDKNNTSKMFAGAYYGGGLFRTTDGGTNWTPVTTGAEGTGLDGEATFSNTAVWGVEIAPSSSNVVWAVHNYWAEKSTDGGSTWTHILNSTMQGSEFRYCKSLAIDPTDSSIVYVGTGGLNSTNTGGAIYKTLNGGTSWTKMGQNASKEFTYTVVDIAINPKDTALTSSPRYNCKGRISRYANKSPQEIPDNPPMIVPSSIFLIFISAAIAIRPKAPPPKTPYIM